MRKKGIAALLIIAVIVIALIMIFTDQWLEKRLENLGSSIVGAKVEIDRLDVSLTGLHVRWDSLQVTDPKDTWTNMLATGKCEFDMEAFSPVL